MSLVAENPHDIYVSSVFIRKDLKVNSIYVCKHGTVEIQSVKNSVQTHATWHSFTMQNI